MNNDIAISVKTKDGFAVKATAIPNLWLVQLYKAIKGHPNTLPLDVLAEDVAKILCDHIINRELLDVPERIVYAYDITLQKPDGTGFITEQIDATDDEHAKEEASYVFDTTEYKVVKVTQGKAHDLPKPWHEWPVEEDKPK